MFSSKKLPHTPVCLTIHIVGAVLIFIAMVASIFGAYHAHVQMDEANNLVLIFGTTSGSLAIIALVLSVTLLVKQCKASMMKCEICK